MSEKQISQVKSLAAEGLKEEQVEKAMDVLTESQATKFKRIYAERQQAYLVFDDAVAKQLSVTDKQRVELKAAAETNAKEHRKMVDFMSRARFRSREAMEEYREGFARPAQQRLLGALVEKQRKQLKEMYAKERQAPKG